MKKHTSAGIVIYHVTDNTIEYLLLRYRTGHWDFPKGKLEAGETSQEAAHRELQEETGLIADIIPGFEDSLSYEFTDYDGQKTEKKVTFFLGKTKQKNIILSQEHIDFMWLPFEQAMQRLTYQNARDILQKAHQFISTI